MHFVSENFNWYLQIQSETPQADPKIEINENTLRLTNQLTAVRQYQLIVKQYLMTLESRIERLQEHQSKAPLIQSDKLKEPGNLLGYWSRKSVISGFVVTPGS